MSSQGTIFNGGIFGNKTGQTNPQQGGIANIFGGNNNNTQGTNAGNQPATGGVNLFNQNNTTNPAQSSNPFTSNQQKPPTTTGLFGGQQSQPQSQSQQQQQQSQQPQQPAVNNPFSKPAQTGKQQPNLFSNAQTGGGIFGQKTQQPKKTTNLFGTNPASSNTTNTGGVTGGLFANNNNQPQPQSQSQTQPTKPTQQQPTTNPTQPTTTTTNPTETTTNPTSTPPATTNVSNIFGSNPTNKATTSVTNPTTTTQSTGNNLFNNATNTTNTFTTNPTNPPSKYFFIFAEPASQTGGGIFNNTQPPATNPQPQSSATNPSQTQPQPQSNTNPIINTQQQMPKTEAQKQFDKVASKTVKQFITTTRQQMQQMYSDLQKYSTNLLRYQKDRDQNVQIFKNFEEMKPQFINNVELNQRILSNLQQQQNEIESHLSLIYNAINPERVDHPLLQCLQESQQLSQQVVMLQAESEAEGGQDIANNPSNEQLLLLYSTLDKLETDVDRMNEILSITFPVSNSNQNNSLYGNHRNYR